MPGHIEETTLRQPFCDICGSLDVLRDRSLSDAEHQLNEHERDVHTNQEPEDG